MTGGEVVTEINSGISHIRGFLAHVSEHFIYHSFKKGVRKRTLN